MVDEFCSERRKETLGHGIVPAVALTAHASTHALGSELSAIVVTGVSFSQDVERQRGIVAVAGRPTDNSTRTQVQHGRQIEPALAGRNGRDVRHPCTIWLGHAELASEQTASDGATVVGIRGVLESPLSTALDAIFSHQTLDAFLADAPPASQQLSTLARAAVRAPAAQVHGGHRCGQLRVALCPC